MSANRPLSEHPEFAARSKLVMRETLKFQDSLAHYKAESNYVSHLKTQLFCWRIYGIGMTIVVVVLTCLI